MRIASVLHVAAVSMFALGALGCADSGGSVAPDDAAPFRALAGRESATFVLARAEAQTAEPIVTVDLTCAGVRYQHTVRDTITLWSDGRARVATAIAMLRNDTTTTSWHAVATGRWVRNTRSDVYYYSDAPSLVLTLQYPGQSAAESWLREAGDAAVTRLAAMGGSCGTGSNGREAVWTYTRR
jgi:hypothetical protein